MAMCSENNYYQRKQQMLTVTARDLYKMRQQQEYQQQTSTHLRTIAPAPVSRSYTTPYMKPTDLKTSYTGTTLDSNNPSVVRRNARERNRVKQVNNGFQYLRQHIPTAVVADLSNGRRGIGPGANKKLSKVDTLRMAVEYIRRLKNVIDEVDSSDCGSVSSFNSCGDSSSSSSLCSSPSPPVSPQINNTNVNSFYQTSQCYPASYSGSFQQLQQQTTMISPTDSTTYSNDSDFYYHLPMQMQQQPASQQIKFEHTSYDGEAEDEEILDYISLWQDDM